MSRSKKCFPCPDALTVFLKLHCDMGRNCQTFLPTLAADSGFFHLEARIHRAFQNFKIYVGVATTFVSGKCSFLLKAEGASTRLRASKLNNADIRSNKPAS